MEYYDLKSNEYFEHSRKEMLEFLQPNTQKILDVGCGTGQFGTILKKKYNVEVWGIEYIQQAALFAQKSLDKVLIGDAQILVGELPNDYFDTIYCNDVLEHFTDPYSLLKQLKSKLNPDGVLICSLPNFLYFKNILQVVFNKDFKYTEEGILDKTHFRFFTKISIHRMMEEAGYKIIQSKGINSSPSFRFKILNLLMPFIFGRQSKFTQWVVVVKK
jgi:2-polyprenyl-3-methyl-5-hydroxy-6-metoxy-1,4-benzoquinol methylase